MLHDPAYGVPGHGDDEGAAGTTPRIEASDAGAQFEERLLLEIVGVAPPEARTPDAALGLVAHELEVVAGDVEGGVRVVHGSRPSLGRNDHAVREPVEDLDHLDRERALAIEHVEQVQDLGLQREFSAAFRRC